MSLLKQSLRYAKIPKLGPKSLQALIDRNIESILDLILLLPLSYKNKLKISFINEIEDEQDVYLEGLIIQNSTPGKIFKAILQDKYRDRIDLVFFRQSPWIIDKLKIGTRIRAYGKVTKTDFGLQIAHPDLEYITFDYPFFPQIEPIYPKIQGIHQKTLIGAIHHILKEKEKYFNQTTLKLYQCLKILHTFDFNEEELNNFFKLKKYAQEDLAFIEGLSYFLKLHDKEMIRQKEATKLEHGRYTDILLKNIPFKLTEGQKNIVDQIKKDLSSGLSMNRLVQGDVGSGKTIIGFIACMIAIDSSKQAAFMAPTEILATQHFQSLKKLYPDHQHIALLTGSTSSSDRKKILEGLKDQSIYLVIGTQTLFQDAVDFKNLGLIVVDEQQRFGVAQRARLLTKGTNEVAHQLILTATPIPRTLAMGLFGQLQISTLNEKPVGRIPILTRTLPRMKIDLAFKSIKNCVLKKYQVYWICPFIEQSEQMDVQAVVDSFDLLKKALPELSIEMLHGRMSSDQRLSILDKFYEKKIDILVSTLVVEVGINNPNAALMIIESPERLGLAQLHQLRGRVGRGEQQSHCLLVYGDQLTEAGLARLQSLCEFDDGFKLAEIDLEIRGPGELFGAKQSGFTSFRFFDLVRYQYLIEKILLKIRDSGQDDLDLIELLFSHKENAIYLED